MANQTWLTTQQAAALAGRDHSTIRRWVSEGRLKVKAVSARLNLVSRRSVEREIERRNGTMDQAEVN